MCVLLSAFDNDTLLLMYHYLTVSPDANFKIDGIIQCG